MQPEDYKKRRSDHESHSMAHYGILTEKVAAVLQLDFPRRISDGVARKYSAYRLRVIGANNENG